MRRPVTLIALATLILASPALAHDFWLQPARYRVEPGQPVPASIWVGHGVNRGLYDADIRRVVGLKSHGPNGVVDRRGQIRQGGQGAFSFDTPGTYVVAIETNHANSVLPDIRFNDYLEEEGLTPAREWREANGQASAEGREIYSRRAKALIRVGTPAQAAAAAGAVTRPIGQTLEIVPDTDPYSTPAGEAISFHILYNGRPQPGVLVKLTNLANDETPAATMRSNRGGVVAFTLPRRGTWQVNAVWTRPISGNPQAEFDTTFSSLTFGY